MVEFIRDCGWQVILSVILLVQFVTIRRLRSIVHQYEYDYYNGVQQVQPMAQRDPVRPLRPLRHRR